MDELLQLQDEFAKIQSDLYRAQDMIESISGKVSSLLDMVDTAIQAHPEGHALAGGPARGDPYAGYSDEELR